MKTTVNMHKEIFDNVIAPTITPKPSHADIAAEFYELQAQYGNLVTLSRYASAKKISVPTASKILKEYSQKNG